MTNLGESCESIDREINREFINLLKSRGRPRSLSGILEKTHKLKEEIILFERNIIKIQKRGNLPDTLELQDSFILAQFQVAQGLKILTETPVLPDSNRRGKNLRHLQELRQSRRVSESDNSSNTLQVPRTEFKERSSSTGDLRSETKMEPPPVPPYVFPKREAMQCIPDYDGSRAELDAFVYHVEHFVEDIPE